MQKDTDDSKRIDELSVLTNQDMKRIEEKLRAQFDKEREKQ